MPYNCKGISRFARLCSISAPQKQHIGTIAKQLAQKTKLKVVIQHTQERASFTADAHSLGEVCWPTFERICWVCWVIRSPLWIELVVNIDSTHHSSFGSDIAIRLEALKSLRLCSPKRQVSVTMQTQTLGPSASLTRHNFMSLQSASPRMAFRDSPRFSTFRQCSSHMKAGRVGVERRQDWGLKAKKSEEGIGEDKHWQLVPLVPKKEYTGPVSVPKGGVILGGSSQRSLKLKKPKSGEFDCFFYVHACSACLEGGTQFTQYTLSVGALFSLTC